MTNLTLKARHIFSQDAYATQATGVAIDVVEQEYARCSVPLSERLRNAMGAVMGGVMFTLADLSFAIAANSHCLADNQPLQWVSLNSSIHYLGQTQGNTLVAETICVKQGGSTCVYTISIHDENDKPIAFVTTTGNKLNKVKTKN